MEARGSQWHLLRQERPRHSCGCGCLQSDNLMQLLAGVMHWHCLTDEMHIQVEHVSLLVIAIAHVLKSVTI